MSKRAMRIILDFMIALIAVILILLFTGCSSLRDQAAWMGFDSPDFEKNNRMKAGYPYRTIEDGKENREEIIRYLRDMGVEPPQ